MKRILNLNGPGAKLAAVSGMFLILVPLALLSASVFLDMIRVPHSAFDSLIQVSVSMGILCAVILVFLAALEQIQDYYFDVDYQHKRNQKARLANGYYECQSCGNRRLLAANKVCPVCGKVLV
jgi:uncharacterized paraquat-inducible protein A